MNSKFFPDAKQPETLAPKLVTHKLVLVGGGEVTSEIQGAFVHLARCAPAGDRGSSAPVLLVCGLASSDPHRSLQKSKTLFQNHPGSEYAIRVEPLDFLTPDELAPHGESWVPCLAQMAQKKASHSEVLSKLKEAQGVFFLGGDQNRILDSLVGTEFHQLLLERWRKGQIVVGGTSAGLQVCSQWALSGQFKNPELEQNPEEIKCSVIRKNHVELKPGFGFLENTILDQHFVVRQRQNRLFSALLDKKECVGIGVDEATALCTWRVPGDKNNTAVAQVVGDSQVFVARCLKEKSPMEFKVEIYGSGDFLPQDHLFLNL